MEGMKKVGRQERLTGWEAVAREQREPVMASAVAAALLTWELEGRSRSKEMRWD